MNTSAKLKEQQMIMGIRGARGHWNTMIQAAYAAKADQATQKTTTAKPVASTRTASKNANTARNRATLAALMAPPKNQTTSEKNLAKLAAVLSK
jgi:hypothetical protein